MNVVAALGTRYPYVLEVFPQYVMCGHDDGIPQGSQTLHLLDQDYVMC